MPTLSTKANRLYPSLPNIDDSLESHTAALQAVKDSIQTHERQDGNYLKSFIRFEELIELGIIDSDGEFVLNIDVETGDSSIALGNLSDVTLTSPADNAILGYDTASGEWIDQTAAQLGLLSASHSHVEADITDLQSYLTDISTQLLNDLLDVVITTPLDKEILSYDLDADRWINQTLSSLGLGLPLGSDYDMLYYIGGVWESTQQLLQWNPTDDYLQLANDHSLNWLDTFGVTKDFVNFASEASGGSAVGHIIQKLYAGVTTTSASYVEVIGAKVDYASMEANEDYAVFVRAYVGAAGGNTNSNGCRLTKGGTPVNGSEMLYEPPWSLLVDSIGMLYCWGGVIDSGASGDLQMWIKSGNGSDIAFANNVTIMMIKVSDLTLDTNVFHDTDTSLIDVSGGGGYQGTGADVTIGDDVSDWLVFGSVHLEDYSVGGSTPAIRVNDGTLQQSGAVITKGDDADKHVHGFMQLWQGVASGTTLTVEADGGAWTVDKTYASIIAIRLNAFEDYNVDFIATSPDLGDGPNDICTVAFTTTGTADYGFISGATGPHAGNQGAPDYIRLDVNGGGDVTIAGSETQFGAANIAGGMKNIHWGVSADQSLSSGDTVDADFHAPDGTTTEQWYDCFLVAFQWQLPAADEFFDVGNAGYVTRHRGEASQFFDVGLTDYVQFDHDGADFNISGFQTANINITDITSIQAGTVDVDFDDITATTYGAIPEANLVDKQAVEIIEEVWTFEAGNLALETGASNPSHTEAILFYDDTIKALSYYNEEADVTVNVGQENLVRVRNATGSTITDGKLVYISGQIGNRPTVSLAKADAIATSYVLGMATHDIEHNSDGYITTLGTVNDLDTSGATEGAQIYLSETTAGAYTETAPTGATEFVVPLGLIMTANVSTGRIYVSVAAAFPHAAALSTYGGGVAGDNDMLHRVGGMWEDTAGALTWDGSALATTGIISLPGGAVGAPPLAFTGDLDTGIFTPAADIFAITAGAIEAVRYTEASSQILADHSMETGITASTTQTQGERPLLSSYNEVSVVTNNDDVVTMPAAAAGRRCLVINKGAKRLQLFPASGDDIGAGIDTSVTIKANTSLLFVGIDGTTFHDVATRLESLQGVDLTGATDNDLLHRSGGDWIDTDGALTWDGSTLATTGVIALADGTEGAPALIFASETDTGIWRPGEHVLAISCGGTEAVRWTGSSPPVVDYAMVSGITASTTQTQGQEPLTCSFNTVTTVANDDDVVTLPPARQGRHCHVINVGANRLQIFPASGQDLGHGVNVSITVKPNSNVFFIGFDATAWQDNSAHFGDLQDVEVNGETDNDLLTFSSGVLVPTSAPIVSSVSAVGTLKLNPLATGDVSLFASADVDNTDNGKRLIILRNAPEGDDWIRMYVTAGQVCYLHTSNDFFLKSSGYVKIETADHIYLDLGDNAGTRHLKIRDVDKVTVAYIDSNGNADFDGNVTGANLAISNWNAAYGWGDHAGAGYEPAFSKNTGFNKNLGTSAGTVSEGDHTHTWPLPPEDFYPAGIAILDNQATFNEAWVELANAGTFARCWFTIRLPSGFSSMAAGYPKVIFKQGTGGTGNYRIAFDCYAGGPGEQLGARLDNIAEYTMAAPGTTVIWEEDVSGAFDGLSLAAGHYIKLRIQRDSDDSLDTFAGDLDVLGVLVKYS